MGVFDTPFVISEGIQMGLIDQLLIPEFYDRIRRLHVLVLAGVDVDSVCACKILQNLFKSDNTQYTLVPVAGQRELKEAFHEHIGQLKVVVLINCGGGINILEHLEPDEKICFFIIDSHRPLELDNIYNQEQVYVIVSEKEEFDFPQFNDIYDSDTEESEDDENYFTDEDSEPHMKRRKTTGSFERRKRKHLWKKKREDLLFKYKELSYHGTAASLIVHQLAVQLSRESVDVIWWSIIGLTEQYLYEKIDREKYVDHIHAIQPHVLRLSRNDDDCVSVNCMKITFENELRLVLYRHWTLYDSLCHSEYVSCRFKTWLTKGHKKFLEFLADMGLPLAQCKEKYSAMDVEIKENLKDWLIDSSRKFGMDDITYSSFVLQVGYKHHFSAGDMVLCVTAFLENSTETSSNFLKALDTLTKGNLEAIHDGLQMAKQQQMSIVNQVRTFTNTHQVVCAGPFIYAYVEEDNRWFANPGTLCRLARYLRETWTVINKKAKDYPFIVCSPKDTQGACVLVGIPPHADDTHKSEFHNAFRTAAERVRIKIEYNFFNRSVIRIQVEDRGKFLDALCALSI